MFDLNILMMINFTLALSSVMMIKNMYQTEPEEFGVKDYFVTIVLTMPPLGVLFFILTTVVWFCNKFQKRVESYDE